MTLATINRLPRLLTIAEVAKHLRLCPKTVRRKLQLGELPSHRLGHQLRVAEADLVAYLARSRAMSP